jgi:hypothetical protein
MNKAPNIWYAKGKDLEAITAKAMTMPLTELGRWTRQEVERLGEATFKELARLRAENRKLKRELRKYVPNLQRG